MIAKELKKVIRYYKFAKFVADWVINEEYWNDNKDAFPEVALRKLRGLGIVKVSKDQNHWELSERVQII